MVIAYMNTLSREAIHDGAVLGFKVDYRNTIISDLLEEEIPDQAYEDKGAHARGSRCHSQ